MLMTKPYIRISHSQDPIIFLVISKRGNRIFIGIQILKHHIPKNVNVERMLDFVNQTLATLES